MKLQSSKKVLRKFGVTMAVPLLVIAGLLIWRERDTWVYFLGAAGFFLLFALTFPRVLSPVEWAWMKLAFGLSYVMTYVLLTVTFYIVITPGGLLMRLFGKDPMERKFEPDRPSYWIPVPEDGPGTRPDKPF